MGRGRNSPLYEDVGGGLYYEGDLREDRKGIYLYDEYDGVKVYIEEERPRERERSRSSRAPKYHVDETGDDGDDMIPLSMPNKPKRKKSASNKTYEHIEPVSSYKSSTKVLDLYNGITHARSLGVNKRLVLTYPLEIGVEIRSKIVEGLIEYINKLILSPDAVYEGPEINEAEDALFSRIINLSFKGIKMIEVSTNLVILMAEKTQKDKGWKETIKRLKEIENNRMITNIFTLNEELVEPILDLMSGTDPFRINESLKGKLNLPASGFVIANNIVLRIDYVELKLFMIL